MGKYYIQKIVNVRTIKKRREYLVKWRNYAHKYNTWEPMRRLIEDEQQKFIREFEKQLENKKKEIKPSTIRKKYIPKRVRHAVWKRYAGKVWETKCNVSWCENKLEVLGSWHVGHNVSEAKGGDFSIDNFRPICQQCNSSMGTTSIDDFSRNYSSYKKICISRVYPKIKYTYTAKNEKSTSSRSSTRGRCQFIKYFFSNFLNLRLFLENWSR